MHHMALVEVVVGLVAVDKALIQTVNKVLVADMALVMEVHHIVAVVVVPVDHNLHIPAFEEAVDIVVVVDLHMAHDTHSHYNFEIVELARLADHILVRMFVAVAHDFGMVPVAAADYTDLSREWLLVDSTVGCS
jgi:hypothetical protein